MQEFQVITVIDPDTKGEVELCVYKLPNGGICAIDASFVEQEDKMYSPFDGRRMYFDERMEVASPRIDDDCLNVTTNWVESYAFNNKIDISHLSDEQRFEKLNDAVENCSERITNMINESIGFALTMWEKEDGEYLTLNKKITLEFTHAGQSHSIEIEPTEEDWWITIDDFDIHYCEEYNEICIYHIVDKNSSSAFNPLVHKIAIQ